MIAEESKEDNQIYESIIIVSALTGNVDARNMPYI